jgi:UDP-glucuronate 4-epimerase
MKILLTGAAGFIGSHLAERLCKRGDLVVGLDSFDLFYPRSVKEINLARLREMSGFSMVEGDVRDPGALARAFAASGGVDTVVHLAALAGVRPSLLEPERFWDVNVTGTFRLFEACRANHVRRMVFASSSSVYGADSAVPFRESDPCARPLSPYAVTKRTGELMAWNVHHLHGLGVTCLRFFTVYGPRQRPDLAIHKFSNLIAQGQPIDLFGDGSTSRDYTWIEDILDGVVSSIDQQARDDEPRFRVYNLGGSQAISLSRLVELISDALGRRPIVVRKPEQPGDMKHTRAEISLAARELGYAPKVSIEEGIPRFVAWWRAERGGS